MNAQPHHGAFEAFPKGNDKCPGVGWVRLELTEPLTLFNPCRINHSSHLSSSFCVSHFSFLLSEVVRLTELDSILKANHPEELGGGGGGGRAGVKMGIIHKK